MRKAITCQTCDGHGFVSVFSHDNEGACSGVSSQTCNVCDGNGFVYVDMSEFDKVKSMTLDQMAIYLYQFAHLGDKPLNVDEVKHFLKGKAQDGKMSFCRRKECCENCRAFWPYDKMPEALGVDFHKVDGADGECFIRHQMSHDHQFSAVKASDLCPDWKDSKKEWGEKGE